MSALHQHVLRLMRSCGSTFNNEEEMQRAMDVLLTDAGLIVQRECYLGPGAGRIDLLVRANVTARPFVGVECKVAGSAEDLTRQLLRYARTGLPGSLIVATTRPTHERIASQVLFDVPVDVVLFCGGLS